MSGPGARERRRRRRRRRQQAAAEEEEEEEEDEFINEVIRDLENDAADASDPEPIV